MSVSNKIVSPIDLTALHERGVHFVLCRAKAQGDKKAKSAIAAGWQNRAESLDAVLKHRAAGGLLGFIPGRNGLWVLDVDKFPDDNADIGALLKRLGVVPLVTVTTKRKNGVHLYFKKADGGDVVSNRNWAIAGFSGEFRGDNGYAICWQLDKLAEALAALPNATPTAVDLFPKPAKGAGLHLVKGNRNNALNAAVFKAAQRGQTDFQRERGDAIAAGLDPAEVDTTIRSASAAAVTILKSAPVSEHQIALGFTDKYRDTMRYCPAWGRWVEWDGQRWRPDTLARAFHYTRTLAGEAGKAKDTRKASFARGVESFCRADPAHAVEASYWDADPWKLGTPGGTVDLKTGRVLAADPGHKITKLTAVGPGESGECPRWLRFLDESTGSDHQLVGFLKRWAGYSLTGSVQEHALVFVYGPGGTGKSVFLSVLSGVLGDYATSAGMDLLTASKYSEHPTEIAVLAGARLVTASETDEGRSWSEARVKRARTWSWGESCARNGRAFSLGPSRAAPSGSKRG